MPIPFSVRVSAFATRFLNLPNGQILFVGGGGGTFLYTPVGAPDNALRPTIQSVVRNASGSFTLTGTQLNGVSYGSSYGDDAMQSTNFPVVYLKDTAGHVFYARTFNFSTAGLRTGSTPVSTQFTLPLGLPQGTFTLFVSANGISSAPFTFVNGSARPAAVPPVPPPHARSAKGTPPPPPSSPPPPPAKK